MLRSSTSNSKYPPEIDSVQLDYEDLYHSRETYKMNPNIPDVCVKCNVEKGTLFYCFWNCPEIRKFWNEVVKCISQMTLNPVPDCPELCFLKLYSEDCMLNSKERKITDLCLVQALSLLEEC